MDNEKKNGEILDEECGEELAIIELTNEEGEVEKFAFIDCVAYENDEYAILAPLVGEDDVSDEVIILKLVGEGNDEDTFEAVTDEATLDAVFNLFLENVDECCCDGDCDCDCEEDDGCDCGCCHHHE